MSRRASRTAFTPATMAARVGMSSWTISSVRKRPTVKLDRTLLPVEDRVEDVADLSHDGGGERLLRQEPHVDEDRPVPAGLLGGARFDEPLDRFVELFARERAGPEQHVAERLLAIARGGEDDVAVPDVDLLLELAAAHEQHARHTVVMHRLEDLGKRGFREVAAELEAAVRHRVIVRKSGRFPTATISAVPIRPRPPYPADSGR